MATKRNGKYKYPYIADPDMYKAVMGACSWIRKDGYFNKSVSYYSRYYGVDADELAAEIRKRQAAGQRGKSRPMYWWVAYPFYYNGDWGEYDYCPPVVVKGASESNVEEWHEVADGVDYGRRVVSGPHKTKKEAEAVLAKIPEEEISGIVSGDTPYFRGKKWPARIEGGEA